MFNSIKKILRERLLHRGIRLIKPALKRYILYNVFKTDYTKNVLLCHLTAPFISGVDYKHTAFGESIEMATVFKELGYNVDVVNWDDIQLSLDEINIHKYQVIMGQGYLMDKIFTHPDIKNILTILYGTGCHPFFLNTNAFARLKQNHESTNQFLVNSMVFNRFLFPLQTSISDYMFLWGNEFTRKTYLPYYLRDPDNIICLPGFFYKTVNEIDIANKDYSLCNKTFLFFGSSGSIHRGLDVLIDYFSSHPELTLHICGSVYYEIDFLQAYAEKLAASKNILVHGFVDITSEKFKQILKETAFYIYPSASEGTSASVLTVVGNGGLIPIITEQCSLDVQDFGIIIKEINYDHIDIAVRSALNLSPEDLRQKSQTAYNYINSHHSINNFHAELKKNLEKILPL